MLFLFQGTLPLGVSVDFLKNFVDQLTAEEKEFTTAQICQRIIEPKTRARGGGRYVDLVKHQHDDSEKPFVGPANVFVSHAWMYKFVDTVDTLAQYAAYDANTFFWIDLFANDQNDTQRKGSDWWTTTLKDQITGAGTVLLVLAPWDNPLPLHRAWCLFEVRSH